MIRVFGIIIALISFVGAQTTGAGLNKAAKAAGKLYFGTAVDNGDLSTSEYLTILGNSQDFGQMTPTNSLKWDATEPNQNQFSFTAGDQIVNLAKQHGYMFRGHNLVWHQQLPGWVTGGRWTNATLTAVLQNHITNVVSRYRGQFYAWDVINEPFNDDGTMRSDIFTQTIGQGYIAIALRAARAADPNVKLYINDFNIEGTGAKSTAMQNLVRSLKSQGVPIDGIGFESHFIVNALPPNIQQNMQAFVNLGVEVAITELDIRMTLPSTSTLLQQQSSNYQTVIEACAAVSKCVGVTLWDYTDRFSWVPGTFSGQGAACPWDQNFNIKPAYNGIIAGFA